MAAENHPTAAAPTTYDDMDTYIAALSSLKDYPMLRWFPRMLEERVFDWLEHRTPAEGKEAMAKWRVNWHRPAVQETSSSHLLPT